MLARPGARKGARAQILAPAAASKLAEGVTRRRPGQQGDRQRARLANVPSRMWRPNVRELIGKIAVRSDHVCHVSVRVDREEHVDDIIRQSPTIVGIAYRLARVVIKDVWEQFSRDSRG